MSSSSPLSSSPDSPPPSGRRILASPPPAEVAYSRVNRMVKRAHRDDEHRDARKITPRQEGRHKRAKRRFGGLDGVASLFRDCGEVSDVQDTSIDDFRGRDRIRYIALQNADASDDFPFPFTIDELLYQIRRAYMQLHADYAEFNRVSLFEFLNAILRN